MINGESYKWIVAEAAKKYGVVTQMGNQGHSSVQTRMLKEWLEDGAIGDVKEVQVNRHRAYRRQ